MILAGDVGGTKTVLALFETTGDELRLVRDGTFPSQAHASLEEIMRWFLAEKPPEPLAAICVGVAGPVFEGKSKTTNLPWQLDEQVLAAACGARHGKLLNDLEAAAFGMLHLRPEELVDINPQAGPRCHGNVAVIAAGTGLGEAIVYWDGRYHHPMATEGGHSSFAPQTEQEDELLRYLRARLKGHVSYERVLSGPGLFHLYCFLRDTDVHREPPELTTLLHAGGDPSALITERGLARADDISVATLELFCSIYGAEAANLALKCLAVGGVLIGGGIAPRILKVLQDGHFLRGFTDKGRFSNLLASLPVQVSLNPRAPLLGAAHYAVRMT
jgi:glucokinase